MHTKYLYPEAIVDGDWLEAHLDETNLRIFDCTTYLRDDGGDGTPYRVESGKEDYLKRHISGSVYLDLQKGFSDPNATVRFMRPSPEDTAKAFADHGISEDSHVILYSRGSPVWATRFWWMLRWIGFDNASLLDGGMDKWEVDGRPLSRGHDVYETGNLKANVRPKLFVDTPEMLEAIGDHATCMLNALTPALYSGKETRYGRPGRIPGSQNASALALFDPRTCELVPAKTAEDVFSSVGALPEKRILNYCGGGIAATLDAFLQHQLGYTDIAVYDASLIEWANTPDLPMEVE